MGPIPGLETKVPRAAKSNKALPPSPLSLQVTTRIQAPQRMIPHDTTNIARAATKT